MDMPGQPIPPGARSTKVTTDPEARNDPITEPSGPVAKDSLAAESSTQGGAYSQNRGAEPLGVTGDRSTFNNTNTSGATKLPSAAHAWEREGPDKKERYPEALGGQGQFPGAHPPESGYAGGSTQAKKAMGIQTHDYPASQKQTAAGGSGSDTYKSQYNGGEAPSYVTPVVQNLGDTKPKGQNLREGGFESNDQNNASFTSDIGSQKDPGRFAENKFQRIAAETPLAAGGSRQAGVDSGNWYQPLERDQRA